MVIFHSYVSLPEGNTYMIISSMNISQYFTTDILGQYFPCTYTYLWIDFVWDHLMNISQSPSHLCSTQTCMDRYGIVNEYSWYYSQSQSQSISVIYFLIYIF